MLWSLSYSGAHRSLAQGKVYPKVGWCTLVVTAICGYSVVSEVDLSIPPARIAVFIYDAHSRWLCTIKSETASPLRNIYLQFPAAF